MEGVTLVKEIKPISSPTLYLVLGAVLFVVALLATTAFISTIKKKEGLKEIASVVFAALTLFGLSIYCIKEAVAPTPMPKSYDAKIDDSVRFNELNKNYEIKVYYDVGEVVLTERLDKEK